MNENQTNENQDMEILKEEPQQPLQYSRAALSVYGLNNFTFGTREPKRTKFKTINEYEQVYQREGMRLSVEAVLLTHVHRHPHIIMLQSTNDKFFKLPGGHIKLGEDEIDALLRKLWHHLCGNDDYRVNFTPGELLGTWYRAEFDQPFFPYLPPHCTKPKEMKRIFVVDFPPFSAFQVSGSFRVVAVPLFDLYDNGATYGPINSSLPQVLSRFDFKFFEEKEVVVEKPISEQETKIAEEQHEEEQEEEEEDEEKEKEKEV